MWVPGRGSPGWHDFLSLPCWYKGRGVGKVPPCCRAPVADWRRGDHLGDRHSAGLKTVYNRSEEAWLEQVLERTVLGRSTRAAFIAAAEWILAHAELITPMGDGRKGKPFFNIEPMWGPRVEIEALASELRKMGLEG